MNHENSGAMGVARPEIAASSPDITDYGTQPKVCCAPFYLLKEEEWTSF
jgi:hypothetical protein